VGFLAIGLKRVEGDLRDFLKRVVTYSSIKAKISPKPLYVLAGDEIAFPGIGPGLGLV